MNGLGGDDVLSAMLAPIRYAAVENDKQYGGRGNDIIYGEEPSGTWSIAAEAPTRPMSTPRTGLWTAKGRGEVGRGTPQVPSRHSRPRSLPFSRGYPRAGT